ncbi:MAG: hypothetical protein ACTSRP_22385, partial [Candidatus Helarchaeota archaeon]
MKSIEDNFYFLLKSYKKMPDWAKIILAGPFRVLPRSFYLGKNYKFFYNQVKTISTWSPDKIKEFQFNKLKCLLEEAYKYVPYYKKKWTEYNINISQIKSIEDFKRIIPFVEKKDIQKNPMQFLSLKYSKYDIILGNTGGSTGTPLQLYYLKGYTRSAYRAHWDFLWGLHGYKTGVRYARLRGDYLGKNRIYSYDPYRNVLILSSFSLKESNADKYIELLRKYKIRYLYGYPSSIINLVNYAKKPVEKLEYFKGVIFGSENVYDYQVKAVKEFFNINTVIKGYGLGEEVALAVNQPGENDYVFLPTHSFVEFHTDENIHFKSDQDIKEIIGTSFVNPAMPLIRYRTGDYVIMPNNGEPRYGTNIPFIRVKDIIGREQDIAIGKSGERITLTALIFGRHSEYFNHIFNLQIINFYPGKLIVKVVPKRTFNSNH